ncbi:MAG: sulfatase-like hydrolase/transferase, partial [Hafnia sp.]
MAIAALLSFTPSIARSLQGFYSTEGLLSDLFCGLLLAIPCLYARRAIRLPLLVIWASAEIGGFILLGTMARLPSWTDLHFLTDTSFLSNSSEQVDRNQVFTVMIIAIPALIVLALPRLKWRESRNKTTYTLTISALILACASLYGQQYLIKTDRTSDNLYAQYSPVHWLGAEGFKILTTNTQPIPADYLYEQDLTGTSLLPEQRKGKNVLIIAMEGMSGIYLRQARESIVFDGDNPPILLPKLSEFAKQGMVTPDYIVHTHQTIRGLYAILCGDFDKLTIGAPKAVEIQNSPERAARCLPSVLRDNGYSTHFLQGAGLAFMGKDKVMPFIGFQQAHGNEWFKKRQHLKFGWGVDDKTFFEGALTYIDSLQRDARRTPSKPWMLTMLTVG